MTREDGGAGKAPREGKRIAEDEAKACRKDRLLGTRQESENTSTIFADAMRLQFPPERIAAADDTRPFPEGKFVYDVAVSHNRFGWRRFGGMLDFRKERKSG